MVDTERKNFENFASLNRRKWHFTSFVSMLSTSQDGLLREMLLSKYRLQIFDYIYIRFQIHLVSKSIGVFFVGAKIIPPPYKTLGSTYNPLENV